MRSRRRAFIQVASCLGSSCLGLGCAGSGLLVLALSGSAHAQQAAPAAELAQPAQATAGASREFAGGNQLAREEKWGEALGAFEASLQLRPHALTLYNIGICERVLGRATRARERFRAALARDGAPPPGEVPELPASIREEIAGFVAEYMRLLPRVSVQLDPKDAGIAVDGRPLRERIEDGKLVLEAGVLAPGTGAVASAPIFDLELDPGTHVFAISRRGYVDVVQTRTFAPGQRGALKLVLGELPATVRISATVSGAQVKLNNLDVGLTPLELSRPGGLYQLAVAHPGYVAFTSEVLVTAGGESNLRINLREERIPLTKRWWFWAGAAGVLAAATTITYFATRETPPPQPYNGGSAGWVVFP